MVAGKFQSPSLRGSGRFFMLVTFPARDPFLFQSPSLRGSGRFAFRAAASCFARSSFQSPSLRGSGRFHAPTTPSSTNSRRFQSPSLRGSGRFTPSPPRRGGASRVSIPFIAGQWSLRAEAEERARKEAAVSIPFIAGQWSLRASRSRRPSTRRRCFNPLHCGAVVASISHHPFLLDVECTFQSPSLRGSGRFHVLEQDSDLRSAGFNPLHCGAVVASRRTYDSYS